MIPIDPGSNPGRLDILSSELSVLSFEEKLAGLSQGKLEKLRKITSRLLKDKKKRAKHTKYGNINKGFTDDELKRFLSSCKHPKAYLAFFLQSHLGLRVSEVVAIKVNDIDWVNNKIRISTLKAHTGDFLYLPEGVRKLLLSWVRTHEKQILEHEGYILFSGNLHQKRPHISPNWLRNQFREVCLLANLDEWYDYADDRSNPRKIQDRRLHRLSTHSLRHFFITKCYNHCKNPVLTQKLARHTDFKSTQTYININYEKLGQVIQTVFKPETETQRDELLEFFQAYAKFKQSKQVNEDAI